MKNVTMSKRAIKRRKVKEDLKNTSYLSLVEFLKPQGFIKLKRSSGVFTIVWNNEMYNITVEIEIDTWGNIQRGWIHTQHYPPVCFCIDFNKMIQFIKHVMNKHPARKLELFYNEIYLV